MKEYHKIDSLYDRDMEGTKRLIEGQYRDKTVEYLANNQWHFTEKVDGTNIRVHWDGHRVSFGGRTDNAQIPTTLLYALQDKFMGIKNEELFEQKFGATPVTLYGEGYGAKIQKGGGDYREDVGFILFDVFINDTWLERENIEDIAKAFDVPVVPIVLTGTIQEAVDFVKNKPASTIAHKEKDSEGLVGKPTVEMRTRMGKRVIVKIKVEDFI